MSSMSQQCQMGAGGGENAVLSKVADRPRNGSGSSTIAGTLALSRGVIKDCEGALAVLAAMERPEADEKARTDADVCECKLQTPGGTMEDALEIDDDDELELLAVTYRPVFPNYMPCDVHGNFILGLPAASGDNSCGSVFNPSTAAERGADNDASS